MVSIGSRLTYAQESIWLAGTNIYLGMTKSKVLSELDGKKYDISTEEQWIEIKQKSGNNLQLGYIEFGNNKVVSVKKNWQTNLGITDMENLNNLFALFRKENDKGKYSYKITTKDYVDADIKFKVITFSGKTRTFKLFLMKDNLQILEVLGKDDYEF